MQGIFEPDGLLASQVAGYVFRPGQLVMAEAVRALLTEEQGEAAACLVVEAETGLGKTLAYLTPAVLSGAKVVISTNTRNLQDQILEREIPLIAKHIAPNLRAMCVKGRQNYLCLHRWRQLLVSQQPDLMAEAAQENIEQWLRATRHADRAELDWLASQSPLWQKICCLSHACLGAACPEASNCFLNQVRRDAASAELLIVNHHLLFSDLALRSTGFGEVLPRYEAVFFDEAHHIEQVATNFFGFSFSRLQLLDLSGDMERSAQSELHGASQRLLLAAINTLLGRFEDFAAYFSGERGRFPLIMEETSEHWRTALTLEHAFSAAIDQLNSLAAPEGGPWEHYALRAQELQTRLHRIIHQPQAAARAVEDAAHIYWYERSERNLSLHASPVDIAATLHKHLYPFLRCCLFTSATLSAGGNFNYFLGRLGLPNSTPCLSLPSPFDYSSRTLVYIPERQFPEPKAPGYEKALHERIARLIDLASGRSLLLFTSMQAMESAYIFLRQTLPYPLFMQGQGPRQRLLRQFSDQVDSVLLAVASFWEGVDVPGETLSLVLIDKLPFEAPSDPVMMARMDRIRSQGGNPFMDFQVPRAIFTLRQGVGRLMRRHTDRGVIAILDVRLATKGYGRQFLSSLPPSPRTSSLEAVADFFQHHND